MAIKIPKTRKKISWKKVFSSFFLGITALALIVFLAFSNWRIYQNRAATASEIKKLEEQFQILQERKKSLEAGLDAAQGESFQEEKLREQGYKKPGEEVIAVLQEKSLDATKQESANDSNFWSNLWQKIKGGDK